MPGGDITKYLQLYAHQPDNPWVFEKAISFADRVDRDSWATYTFDSKELGLFSNLLKEKKDGKKVWMAFMSVPTGMQIGNLWEGQPWHCFAMCVLPRPGSGKMVIIYDCDPRTTVMVQHTENGMTVTKSEPVTSKTETSRVLWGRQRSIITYIRTQIRTVDLWYNMDDSNSGQNKCLYHSFNKMYEWSRHGNMEWQGNKHACYGVDNEVLPPISDVK